MSIKWRNRTANIAFLFAFFVIGSIANVTWNEPLSLTGTMVFSSLCIMWTASIQSRIIRRREKRYFFFLGAFMLMWMVERAIKYSFFLNNEWLERTLWYAYYIPLILMPLISLMIAIRLGKTDDEQIKTTPKLLFIPALLLILGIMTNDLHQLAFRFKPNFENRTYDYSYGVLYYIALAWIIVCALAALVLAIRFSTISSGIRRGLIPLAVIFVSLAGVAVYIFTDFRYTRIMNVPELFCFCVAAFWEACLQTGLLPSNTGYDLLFNHSHLAARITDFDGKPVYEAATEQADGEYIRHCKSVSGGQIEWLEDVTAVTQQKRQLEIAKQRLENRAELQEQENKLKEERIRIAEQKMLYDKMNASFAPQTELIRRLVSNANESEEKWKENMLWVCVIGAYIKRKSNLILLSANSERISFKELQLAYLESFSYLTRAGVDCEIGSVPEISLPSGLLLYAYDEFETLLEKKSSILFDIKFDETPLMFEFDKEGAV